MSPVEAPASDTQALRELDRPTPAEVSDDGLNPDRGGDEVANPGAGRAGNAPTPVVVRDARARPRGDVVAPPRNKLYQKVEQIYDRVEAFVSRLSVRDNFWHSVCSLIWLPLAFFSGIRLKMVDTATKAFDSATNRAEGAVKHAQVTAKAVLPFRRFNRNWYRAMAGGALLANSEIAGGMYVFGVCGGDYTVVCKNLNYTFLRPCYGPAVYRAEPRQDLKALIAERGEFNITLDMDIRQLGVKPGEREKRVGRAEITFHVTPKGHAKVRQKKLKQRDRQKAAISRGR